MADLGSDHDAVISLIISEYNRLHSHNPEHNLLKYIKNVNNSGFENVGEKYEEFLNKFESQEDKKSLDIKVVKVLASYFVALRNASDEIEGIHGSSKPKNPIKTIETKVELLFL